MIDRIFGYKINFNFQEPLQRFPLRPLPDAIPSKKHQETSLNTSFFTGVRIS